MLSIMKSAYVTDSCKDFYVQTQLFSVELDSYPLWRGNFIIEYKDSFAKKTLEGVKKGKVLTWIIQNCLSFRFNNFLNYIL